MPESYYDSLIKQDIISLVRPLLEGAGWGIREEDGKILASSKLGWDTPWHHVRPAHDMPDCYMWHKVIFDFVGGFVPSRCQQCFKTVVRLKTLKQLFALLEVEQELDLPSKCGIETRDYTPALYGGYFYGFGLEDGLNNYKKARAAIDAHPDLGPGVEIILKRACTEMELACGPSDRWERNELGLATEALFERYVVRDRNPVKEQSEAVLIHVHRRWIEWAFAAGDETYLEYTGGQPLFPKPVTYHHLAKA